MFNELYTLEPEKSNSGVCWYHLYIRDTYYDIPGPDNMTFDWRMGFSEEDQRYIEENPRDPISVRLKAEIVRDESSSWIDDFIPSAEEMEELSNDVIESKRKATMKWVGDTIRKSAQDGHLGATLFSIPSDHLDEVACVLRGLGYSVENLNDSARGVYLDVKWVDVQESG